MKTFIQFNEAMNSTLDNAKRIAKVLRDAGYQAYLVGGCVRDTILGTHPKDYDLATDAVPDHVLKLFPNADKVGAHFGVVIEDGIEIATFRSDSVDGDGRRPTHVTYEKTARADASRRDFTCNALFMDPFTGHILDFFGGVDDIKHKVLRAVGDPNLRFHEDHLRMMRAMRFAAKLGFTIDPATLEAMQGQAHEIKGIAVERPTEELRKALVHDPVTAITIMKHTGLLAHVIPAVDQESSSDFAVTMKVLGQLHFPNVYFALTALFVKLRPQAVLMLAKRLKLTNEEQEYAVGVLSLQPRILAAKHDDSLDVLKKLMRDRLFVDALSLYGMRVHVGDAPEAPFHFLTELYAGMKHEDLHPVRFVTGNDLISMGMKPGRSFSDILNRIEVGQLTGEITSREQALALANR